jgi:hypothetical protein
MGVNIFAPVNYAFRVSGSWPPSPPTASSMASEPPSSTSPGMKIHLSSAAAGGKCRTTTADFHSLDASAALSRRPLGNDAGEAPGVAAVATDLVTRRP